MKSFRSNVKVIIWSGFSAVIVLMMILSAVAIYQLNQQAIQFRDVVKVNNTKIRLVNTMRDAVRLRSLSLNRMALSSDLFYRDGERLNFDKYASGFRVSYAEFKKFDLDANEKKLIKLTFEKIAIGFPLNQKALDMLLSDKNFVDINPVTVKALVAQEAILVHLDALIVLQQSYAEQSLSDTELNLEQMMSVLIGVVTFAILLSIILSLSVSKIVTRINATLQAAIETKSMFLANMSHEIRTPLTAIIGFAKSQMIPDLSQDHSLRASKIILRNSEHLLAVINDILDFTKLESDKLEVENKDFSLFNLMNDVKATVLGAIGEKPVNFAINYNYPLPDYIHSDKTRLRQILLNLTSNAVKFTEQGCINLNIRYDRSEHSLMFELHDSGIGMTLKQQDIIFQTFNQADISTTRKYGGTGLGLSISQSLVNKLGGELTVTSEPDVGSCFSFMILNHIKDSNVSFKYVNNTIDNQTSNKEDTAAVDYTTSQVMGSVLLVEDMPDNQELLSFYLQEMGADVVLADNGKIAVDMTQESKFDLILMDMQMPVMGGFEAVSQIRDRGDTTPIVVVTANTMQEDREQSLALGCDGFMTKPVDEDELSAVVKKYLKAQTVSTDNDLHEENNQISKTTDKLERGVSKSLTVDSSEVNASRPLESPAEDVRESVSLDSELNNEVIISTLIQKNPIKYDKFITKFVNHLPTYIDEFSENISSKNDTELKAVAHKLKGVGGNMGYVILTEISKNFELAIKQHNRDEIERLFIELKAVAQRIYRGNESKPKDSRHA